MQKARGKEETKRTSRKMETRSQMEEKQDDSSVTDSRINIRVTFLQRSSSTVTTTGSRTENLHDLIVTFRVFKVEEEERV